MQAASLATFSNRDDTIDSTDVEDRLAELRELRDDQEGLEDEDQAELEILERLSKQGQDYADDWDHGVTLIRDSYFATYARELIEESGDVPKNLHWSIVIDWESTAENYRSDYTPLDFDGVTYWVR
jgi:hypothetical protein